MKILFFILGSIESRIIGWGKENMQEVLDEDIVFFGPIKENKFTDGEKDYPLISFNSVIKIDELFSRLPNGWYPDIIVCDVSTVNFIPDIYKSPVKTYLLGRDGWGDMAYNRGLCEFFDFLSYGGIDRENYKSLKVNVMPLYGMPVSIPINKHNIPDFNQRKIDVISIANYKSGFYHDRFYTLYKFAKENAHLNIKYYKGLKRHEIHDYYQNAKIVLDRSHTLSNRSYEAAWNGCLLFSHEENTLMSEFWTPFENYIPYNDKSINELIKHYLNNPKESTKVIESMRDKLKDIPSTFRGSIKAHLKEAIQINININERIERNKRLPISRFYHRLATGFYFYYFYNKMDLQLNWQDEYFTRIDKAINSKKEKENDILKSLIEATRFSFLLKNIRFEYYIKKLIELFPEYAWSYYLYASWEYNRNNYVETINNCEAVFEKIEKHYQLLVDYPMPFTKNGDDIDIKRVTSHLWELVFENNKETDIEALQVMTYELIGDSFIKIGQKEKALKYYFNSADKINKPKLTHKVGNLLLEKSMFQSATHYLYSSLKSMPYDTGSQIMLFETLIRRNKKRSGKILLKKHIHSLLAFRNSKKIKAYVFYLKFLYLIALFPSVANLFNSKFGGKFRKKLIKF